MIAEALVYPLEMTRRQLQVESIAAGRLIGDSAMRRTLMTLQQIVLKVSRSRHRYFPRICVGVYMNMDRGRVCVCVCVYAGHVTAIARPKLTEVQQ